MLPEVKGSGCFAVDSILPFETILQKSFMCVYIAIIATILQVTQWCVDSAPTLKCNSHKLESWLAGHLEKGIVH